MPLGPAGPLHLAAAMKAGFDPARRLPTLDASRRIPAVQEALVGIEKGSRVDALVVSDLVNIRWCCGFTGSSARLVIPVRGRATLLTDSRYAERAAEETQRAGASVRVAVKGAVGQRKELTRLLRDRRVGLEGGNVTWDALRAYRRDLEAAAIVAVSGVVEAQRRSKDAYEVSRLARAGAIADAAFLECLPLFGASCTELEFARAFTDAIMTRGAEGDSFASIIASGPNASRPHHDTGSRRVRPGDLVICDLGALVDGYHSDMTRTVQVGAVRADSRRVLDVVLEAQAAGSALVGAGRPVREVDAACRRVIGKAGWAKYFNHGTGHGVGLVIHEAPWVNGSSADVLAVGETCTVEPGVYLPGKVGARIEDCFVITDSGAISITRTPYDLQV